MGVSSAIAISWSTRRGLSRNVERVAAALVVGEVGPAPAARAVAEAAGAARQEGAPGKIRGLFPALIYSSGDDVQ